jgi:predicted nucleic acid-binding protein
MKRRFVVDSSLAVSWCLSDESTDVAEDILSELKSGSIAVCPALWIWEVNNALLQAERRGRLAPESRLEQLFLLQTLSIELDDTAHYFTWGNVNRLAEKYTLTIYDATYLEMALRHGLPLASLDKALRNAAKHSKVDCLPEKLS